MSELDADVARVAALRGKRREDYIDPGTGNYRTFKSAVVPPQLVALLFQMHGNADADLAAYDELSETARRYVRNCPLQLNAECYRAALDHIDEEALEVVVQSHVPGQVARWLRRHYGDSHPSLRKLP